MKTPPPETPRTIEDWAYIQTLFPRFGRDAAVKWLGGISPRLTDRRLSRLLALPAATPLAALLDQRSPARIKALRTFAAVNMEQASAALRMTIVVNASIPAILIATLSQVSGGRIWSLSWALDDADVEQWSIIVAAILGGALCLGIILGLGATRLGKARDIRHLIDLMAAERGIYFGLDDMDDLDLQ